MPQTCSRRALGIGRVAGTLAAAALSTGATAPAAVAAQPWHDAESAVAISIRGPLALVEVTRPLSAAPGGRADAGEALLDLALPAHAVLLSADVRERTDAGRWRSLTTFDAAGARAGYADALQARGLTPVSDATEEGTSHRLRVVWTAEPGQGGPVLRYRFSALLESAGERLRLRFPSPPDRFPLPTAINLRAAGAADIALPGQRIAAGAHASTVHASGRAPAGAAWEVSYLPRPADAAKDGRDGALIAATAATARLPGGERALAVVAAARLTDKSEPPSGVLFLIDRSRSVGLPGLSAQRDVARQLMESLPPDTPFDALFFDRAVKRLFATARPATGEALAALDGEMVPDRLANGTDVALAFRTAGQLLRREGGAFGSRPLLVMITDGALPDADSGDDLQKALGAVPGLELSVAVLLVRASDDETAPAPARAALRRLVAGRGGIQRDISAGQIPDGLRSASDALARGGDLFRVELVGGERRRAFSPQWAPGEGATFVERWPAPPSPGFALRALHHGTEVTTALRPVTVPADWLRPLAEPTTSATPWYLSTARLTALAEPVPPAASSATAEDGRGTVDRTVVQNTLALAFMPRARACYQTRTAATPAARDLTGRVRLAIDLIRGEVAAAHIESSTLGSPIIESCLRESAFALEVPRASRSDAPVTAIVNLVFRPRPAEKIHTAEDTFPIGDEIDLALEELRRFEQARAPAPTNSR